MKIFINMKRNEILCKKIKNMNRIEEKSNFISYNSYFRISVFR